MKSYAILILFFLLSSTLIQAQETQQTDEDFVYNSEIVEIKPEYPGGITEFLKFIGKNFKIAVADFQGGKVIVSFVVESDGSLSDIKVLRDAGFGSGDQIKKLLTISQKWIPGQIKGRNVNVSMALPIVLPSLKTSSAGLTEYSSVTDNENAEFPGGIKKFYEFIKANFKTPAVEKGVVVSDVSMVSFIIGKDGDLKDIKVKKDLGYGTGPELVRVLELSPKWIAASRRGEKIESFIEIPIPIELFNPDTDTSEIIYESEIVQYQAHFPSGIYGLIEFVYSKLRQMGENLTPVGSDNIKGTVALEFVVNTDGTLQDFKVLQEAGYRSGLYSVKAMAQSPKWIPAIKNGKYVRSVCRIAFPVNK